MKKIVILIIMLFGITACTKPEYKKIMEENEFVIIDVRSNFEYSEGHIKNSINIPHDEINENIEIEKNKVIFVYCKSGNRSKYAYDLLKSYGYDVYDLGAYQNIDLEKEK